MTAMQERVLSVSETLDDAVVRDATRRVAGKPIRGGREERLTHKDFC
jgi:hypothetical protein